MTKRTIIAPESKTKKIEIELKEEEVAEAEQQFEKLAAHRRALQKYDQKQQFTSLAEEIAQDTLCIGTVKFPGADEAYPDITQSFFRFVSKLYPNAKGGPLYVDHPKNETEVYRAYERHKVMKKLGHRHIIIEKDSCLSDLLEQLGEL